MCTHHQSISTDREEHSGAFFPTCYMYLIKSSIHVTNAQICISTDREEHSCAFFKTCYLYLIKSSIHVTNAQICISILQSEAANLKLYPLD